MADDHDDDMLHADDIFGQVTPRPFVKSNGADPRVACATCGSESCEGHDSPIAERFPVFAARLRTTTRPSDIVADLIPHGLSMIHGQPRALKTWSAQELARAISTASPAFGVERFAIAEAFETWYVTEEDAEWQVHDRFRCLFAGHQQEQPNTLHVSVQKAISFDDPAWQRRLIEYAADNKIAVTIIDPIRASSIAVDQGPKELKPLSTFLREFMRRSGSAISLVHHDVKPPAGKPDDRARPQRASGGGIFSIADAPIHAELFGEVGSQTLLTPGFYKFAVAPPPLLVTLTADDPKRPTWARLTGETTTSSVAADLVLRQKVRDYLREHPATSGSKIAKAIHANKARTFDTLEALFAAGEVDSFQRGQAKLWRLLSQPTNGSAGTGGTGSPQTGSA